MKLNRKTGFKIIDPYTPVNIADKRGKPFYSTDGRNVTQFNLPEGIYIIETGKITPLRNPINFRLPRLPKAQRNRKFPFDFKSVVGDNPNKCSIFWNRKIILWDYSMMDLTLPELYFILFHEFCHAKYSDEDLADLGSAYMMLKKGFNPSQIVRSPITSLSDRNFGRKMKLYNRMLNSRYES